MNHKRVLESAVEMEYKSLFHSKEHEEEFFNNPDSIIIESEDNNVILFIERDEGINSLYWAGETVEDVAESLRELNKKFPKGTIIKISCCEDKDSKGLLEKIANEFINVGCKSEVHFVGFKASTLDGVETEFNEVVKAKTHELNHIYGIIDRSLGGDKFKMNEHEMKEYMNNSENNVFTIKENGNIAGIVFTNVYGNKSKNTKSLFIRGLAVDEKYRGKGYSKKLMKKAFNWGIENGAINSMLWVEKYNNIAINLYEKFGYKPYGDEEMILKYTIENP
ncbi:GNAT family N-acetyltransferase [Oceanirhabdus sp. W0125-5]|uniref:GNAT family N-acetyltransferase n=1 Tax=Oceanirhabdus sp. W0125-5 TaxID=2999116 RepID=UPI0022F2CD68|nr:GNAT family N-acetyltransferase [Oceanirhabdus sp. W0125-5]WBW97136.1 GNAT family N-acetyltransferase [Oceanirhabdus sp. W0125-5]